MNWTRLRPRQKDRLSVNKSKCQRGTRNFVFILYTSYAVFFQDLTRNFFYSKEFLKNSLFSICAQKNWKKLQTRLLGEETRRGNLSGNFPVASEGFSQLVETVVWGFPTVFIPTGNEISLSEEVIERETLNSNRGGYKNIIPMSSPWMIHEKIPPR